MTDALNRAHRCRDLAEEYRRLAAIDSSTDIRARYLRMAEYYSKLAEAEEPSRQARVNDE
jgi:predicted signal transduction protein with EAL and GGDEF domain